MEVVAQSFPSEPSMSSSPSVTVVASTWARDSHELFDFESKNLYSKTMVVQGNSVATRSGSEVGLQRIGEEIQIGNDPLVQVVERNGMFCVDRPNQCSGSRKLWMVVRQMAPCGYKLSEGDCIKLGRLKFRIRQLVNDESTQPNLRMPDMNSVCMVKQADQTTEDRTCRICLMEGPGDDDPLISPCDCKGSIVCVHLKCLRHWTKNRLCIPGGHLGSYYYRPLQCELCKCNYPGYLSHDGITEEPLMEVPRTQPPFIVLENAMPLSRGNSASRGLHVISLAEKPLMLGRGHESDIRIADVSMSRCHASIRAQGGQFLLQDNESKFGTLVALRRPFMLEASKPLCLQVGRTVLSLCVSSPPARLPIDESEEPHSRAASVFGSDEERRRAMRYLFQGPRSSPQSTWSGAAASSNAGHWVPFASSGEQGVQGDAVSREVPAEVTGSAVQSYLHRCLSF